jgi:hypothetical protein
VRADSGNLTEARNIFDALNPFWVKRLVSFGGLFLQDSSGLSKFKGHSNLD